MKYCLKRIHIIPQEEINVYISNLEIFSEEESSDNDVQEDK